MNVQKKQISGADAFFGASALTINGYSNKFYIKVQILDNLPLITLSVVSVSFQNRVTIAILNANRLIYTPDYLFRAVKN
jgi:hypothetical protein